MTYIKLYDNFLKADPILILAVKNNNIEHVKMLIKSGVDVNCTDLLDWTPLLWATYRKNIIMMKMLIDAGADIHYKALHHIRGTKKMVDFYQLAIDKNYYDGGYKKVINWIEKKYPELKTSYIYNL